ncbi:hypothetical protein D9M68_964590 [compost metagenome]
MQHAHALVAVAHHHHGLVADRGGDVVAGVRHLAVVADVDPGVGVQAFHFQVEQFLVDEQVFVHLGVAQQGTNGVGVVAVFGHGGASVRRGYRSSTRRADFAREMQIWMILPLAFSVSER